MRLTMLVISDIASVSAHNRNCKFYCICCGGEMRPRLGNINVHHFAHKADTPHCSPESYLHKLAKRRIKEKFYSDKPFEISYSQETICSNKTTCPFYRKDECCSIMRRKYDLKHHYDTCDEEQPIGDFVADLLISSQNRPEIPPILIEIQVSHKCEESKISSGFKIIEIRITKEEDIDVLLNSPITETDGWREKDIQTISFFGFKKNTTPELLETRAISKFYLFKSGKAYVTNMYCQEVSHKNNPNAVLEIGIDWSYLDIVSPYEIGYTIAKQLGFKIKNCLQCKYRKNAYEYAVVPNICCLYKTKGTPQYPEGPEAESCQYYREDSVRKQEVDTAIKTTPILIAK